MYIIFGCNIFSYVFVIENFYCSSCECIKPDTVRFYSYVKLGEICVDVIINYHNIIGHKIICTLEASENRKSQERNTEYRICSFRYTDLTQN